MVTAPMGSFTFGFVSSVIFTFFAFSKLIFFWWEYNNTHHKSKNYSYTCKVMLSYFGAYISNHLPFYFFIYLFLPFPASYSTRNDLWPCSRLVCCPGLPWSQDSVCTLAELDFWQWDAEARAGAGVSTIVHRQSSSPSQCLGAQNSSGPRMTGVCWDSKQVQGMSCLPLSKTGHWQPQTHTSWWSQNWLQIQKDMTFEETWTTKKVHISFSPLVFPCFNQQLMLRVVTHKPVRRRQAMSAECSCIIKVK